MATSTSIELGQLGRPIDNDIEPRSTSATDLDPSNVFSDPETPQAVLDDENRQLRQEFSLPQADGGKDAWLFLMSCAVLEALVWGFPFSFGIFQDYYRTYDAFRESSNIAVIGTCAMGIMYVGSPLVVTLIRLYPQTARWGPLAGLLTMCAALGLSSLAQNVTHLILSQGILYAIGGSMCYFPCIVYMDQWFVKRKGFAFGVMWSGTGVGGCTVPLLLELFLNRYGFRTTLQIWTIALFVTTIPLVWFIKPRLPASSTAHIKPYNVSFMFKSSFAVYQIASIVEAIGFFLPSVYLPTFARSTLGASSFMSATTILAINIASVLGCLSMGVLVDKLAVTTCIMISTIGAVIGTFLLWGFAVNLPVLYLFCIVYGIFAGSYTATWPGIMRQLMMVSPAQSVDGQQSGTSYDPMMIFSFLTAGRGIGNLVSGPLSEALISGMPWQGQAGFAYGSGYGPLIAFTGATAALGGASYVCKRVGLM